MSGNLFYLRMPAATAARGDGARCVLLALGDCSKVYRDAIRAEWHGDEAVAWFDQHHAELKPGRALRVEFAALWARNDEIKAKVASCELAPIPPSWRKHHDATHPDHQEHASA